jgi:hypothetical protein
MKYDRAKLSRYSKDYPKLDPLRLTRSPDDAFLKVRAAANTMPEWLIVFTDPATRTIEGVGLNLFRFRDDFVIQVRRGPT